jgi:hypothetical protein
MTRFISDADGRARRRGLADAWIVGGLLAVSALFAGRAAWHTWQPAAVLPAAAGTAASWGQSTVTFQPIETIRVGQKVWVDGNPSGERDERFGEEVLASRWRKMVLRAPKRDGGSARAEMIRPVLWLAEHGVHAGGQVDIEVPECGIAGLADVLAVEPCPEIPAGPGRVVTATFHHQSAETIDLAIEGLVEPIGCTANHPIWSETKQEFVRADALQPGEQVLTLGGVTRVASIRKRGPPEPVYNIEVHVDHTYHVSTAGLLVHNGGPALSILNPCFVPTNAAKRDFGIAVHQEFPDGLAKRYPNSEFRSRVGPFDRGPDAPWAGKADPGFDFAELKPRTATGRFEFAEQLGKWEREGYRGRYALF